MCVCVCERERKRQREREKERERQRVCVVCARHRELLLCVCVCLRVFPISRSSLIIELILSGLLGRYTAASHSVSFSSSHALHLSLLVHPSCCSPLHLSLLFLADPSVLSLSLSLSLCPIPLFLSYLSNPSCSLTSPSPLAVSAPSPPLQPAALHHPSPPASLALSSGGERSKLPLVLSESNRLQPALWGGGE